MKFIVPLTEYAIFIGRDGAGGRAVPTGTKEFAVYFFAFFDSTLRFVGLSNIKSFSSIEFYFA